jgi:hypothetical protein
MFIINQESASQLWCLDRPSLSSFYCRESKCFSFPKASVNVFERFSVRNFVTGKCFMVNFTVRTRPNMTCVWYRLFLHVCARGPHLTMTGPAQQHCHVRMHSEEHRVESSEERISCRALCNAVRPLLSFDASLSRWATLEKKRTRSHIYIGLLRCIGTHNTPLQWYRVFQTHFV